MILAEFGVEVLDFILDDCWIAETRTVYHFHTLLHDKRVRWVSHLEERLLLQTEHSIVCVQVWNGEVKDVRAGAFFQTACQFEQTIAK